MTKGQEAQGNGGKVAMTIRIGSLQAAGLKVMAESSGRTVDEVIDDIIKSAALEYIIRSHRNKDAFVRVVDHESATDAD